MQVSLTSLVPPTSVEHSPQHWFHLQSLVSLTQGHLRRWGDPTGAHREMQFNHCVQHRAWEQLIPGEGNSTVRSDKETVLGEVLCRHHCPHCRCPEAQGKNLACKGLEQKCNFHFSGSHKYCTGVFTELSNTFIGLHPQTVLV